MAKQTGPIFFTGTIGNITGYQLDGVYYARKKSSLSGKKVKTHRHFKRTMENAFRLADASKIASAVYRLIPRSEKQHTMYREMTGVAINMLNQGCNKEEILSLMIEKYVSNKFKERRRIKEWNKGKELIELEVRTEKTGLTEKNEIKEDIHGNEMKTAEQKREAIKNRVPGWVGEPSEVVYIPVNKKQVTDNLLQKEFKVPWFRMN